MNQFRDIDLTEMNQIFTYILTIPESSQQSQTKSDARVQIEAKSDQIIVTREQIEPTQAKSDQTQPWRTQIEPPRYQIGSLEPGEAVDSAFF